MPAIWSLVGEFGAILIMGTSSPPADCLPDESPWQSGPFHFVLFTTHIIFIGTSPNFIYLTANKAFTHLMAQCFFGGLRLLQP
jgi:hypothetical protein